MMIDMTLVPAPDVVEQKDFETVLTEMKADMLVRDPLLADALAVESEPITHLLNAAAYREMNLRKEYNDAAHELMLAYSTNLTLDQFGINRNTPRLDGELNAAYRLRVQKAFNVLAAAGPDDAFIQHALSLDASIIDVTAVSLVDGQATITVLAPDEVSTADATSEQIEVGLALFPDDVPASGNAIVVAGDNAPLLVAVRQHLLQTSIKPLTDVVIVRGPTIVPFTISAEIIIYPGPDPLVVMEESKRRLVAYQMMIRRMDYDATRSGIEAALTAPGVQDVLLTTPVANIKVDKMQIAVAISVDVTMGGIDA